MTSPAGARPRLLILTIDCPPDVGGIQRVIGELAHGLDSRWEVTVIAPGAADAREHDQACAFRIRRTRMAWHEARLRTLAEMAWMARISQADVVLAGHVSLLSSVVAAARGRPIVLVVYGSELWSARVRLTIRIFGRRVRRALAISRFTADQAAAAGLAPERIAVTALGARLPATTSDDEQALEGLQLRTSSGVAPYLLTVARLDDPHKGHDIVIRALPELLAIEPNLRYVLAGAGSKAPDLAALADSVGVGHAVQFTGAVDETTKAALLRHCRAFVMLSREIRRPPRFEGFGIAYLEAALAGKPSLAGRSGGTADAVVHQETGLLVDPLSVPETVAAAARLLLDPEYANQLGRAGQARAEANFTWERAVERIHHCLESVPR